MALGERTTSQALHDLLTAVTRSDQAILTALEHPDVQGLERAWRTLVNPDEARPEDLRQLSDRLFGVDGGFFGFMLDMGLSPTMWFGLPLARGASKLGFGTGKPTRLMNMWVRDFGAGYTPQQYQNYAQIMERSGLGKFGRMGVVQHSRLTAFREELRARVDSVVQPWIQKYGREAWEKRKADMVEFGMFHEGADAARDPEVMKMINEVQERLHNHAWDHVSIIEGMGEMTEADKVGAKQSGKILDFLRLHLDTEPMGYVSKYLPWMADPDKEGLDLTLDALNPEKLKNTPIGRLAMHTTDIASFKNVKGAALGEDTAESAMALNQLLSDGGLVRKLVMPYRNPRMRQVLDQTLAEKIFQMDWDKIIEAEINRTARSWSLQVPLTPQEARFIHGTLEDFVDTDRVHKVLMPKLRQAMAAKDGVEEAAVRGEIADIWSKMPYHQRSIDLQMTLDAAEHFGADVFSGKSLYHLSTQRTAQARALQEFMRLLRGQQDVKEFVVSNWMARMYNWIGEHLTDDRVAALDQVGMQLGAKTKLGTALKDELLNGQNLHNMAHRERMLTRWSYLAGLGLRPIAALLNLSQVPLMGPGTIGWGNTFSGAWQAGSIVRESLRKAWVDRQLGNPANFGLLVKKHLLDQVPEMKQYGLVQDIRELEMGVTQLEAKTRLEKVGEFFMGPFTWTETWNRLATFLGARKMWNQILRENPEAFGFDIRKLAGVGDNVGAALEHADVRDLINREAVQVVGDTQFVPTPGRRTPFQSRWLKGPAMMQFSSYPIGFTNWFMDAGMRGAIDQKAGLVAKALHEAASKGVKVPAGLNTYHTRSYLPYARYLVAMTGLTNLGRDVLGFDIAERAAGGMAPLPISDEAPFYPFPVPPIPGAVFGTVKAALTGNVDDMQPLEVPGGKIPVPKMFVPGGVAVSHAFRTLNQIYFNGFSGDELASDEQGDGQAYMDFAATALKAMGAMPEMTRREQQQVRQLFAVRKKMTEYRRRMSQAVLTGNSLEIARVKQEYAEDPQFTGAPPLKVDTDDLKRVYRAMRTSNFNRQIGRLRTAADALGLTTEPLGLLTPEEEEALKAFKTGTILLGGQAA